MYAFYFNVCNHLGFPLGEASSLDGADKEEGPSGSALCWSLYEERRQVSHVTPIQYYVTLKRLSRDH